MLAHYLGLGDAADAFAAAFRIPNFLQNLLGEGVLSASFIPVYARLIGQGRQDDARRVAGAVLGLLAVVTAAVVAIGVTTAPWLVTLLAPGFHGAKHDLTVQLVRVLFPGVGLLVLSAWCLGVLNSHRRFFLSYAAPVIWNVAIIAVTLVPGIGAAPERIVVFTAWGALAGSLLQFAVQLPEVRRLLGEFRPSLDASDPGVRTVLANFGPAFVSRGVAQISAFVDAILASLLPTGAVAALMNAQLLYTLPVSLFGMSVAAAELPELSEAAGQGESAHAALRERLERAMRQVTFFVVPSAIAFLTLGQVIAAAVFQTGRFTADDARYVWMILIGATVGLLATTLARLYASAWYALQEAKRPMRFALIRVVLTIGLGYVSAVHLPGWLGVEPRWGAVGLTASAGVAGWLEFALLRRSLHARIGVARLPVGYLVRLWGAGLLAAVAGWGMVLLLRGQLGPVLGAALVLGAFGTVYVMVAWRLGIDTARDLITRLRRA